MSEGTILAELQLTRDLLLASNKRIENQQRELHEKLSGLAVKFETLSLEEDTRDRLLGSQVRATKALVVEHTKSPGWNSTLTEALNWLLTRL
jgi:UDP-N-acetylglucosamine transferase subunit ALG13